MKTPNFYSIAFVTISRKMIQNIISLSIGITFSLGITAQSQDVAMVPSTTSEATSLIKKHQPNLAEDQSFAGYDNITTEFSNNGRYYVTRGASEQGPNFQVLSACFIPQMNIIKTSHIICAKSQFKNIVSDAYTKRDQRLYEVFDPNFVVLLDPSSRLILSDWINQNKSFNLFEYYFDDRLYKTTISTTDWKLILHFDRDGNIKNSSVQTRVNPDLPGPTNLDLQEETPADVAQLLYSYNTRERRSHRQLVKELQLTSISEFLSAKQMVHR